MEGLGIIVFILIWGGIFATIAGSIAHVKGRNVAGWAISHFFLSLTILTVPIAIVLIIVLSVLPNLKDQKAKDDRQERENRRLREQLRQERMKGESFRQHTLARLDQHDQHAGIDTRQANMALPGKSGNGSQPMLESQGSGNDALDGLAGAATNASDPYAVTPTPEQQQQYAAAQAQTRHTAGGRFWHFENAGQTEGPISEQQLIAKLQSGEIASSTLVWTEELGDWKSASDIRALQPFLSS